MSISLPSKRIPVVDVPEVEQLSGEFVYNFFSPDERVNESGTAPQSILRRPSESFDADFIIGINRVTPRYVKFSWKPSHKGGRNFLIERISIQRNYKKIHSEETFTSDEFTNTFFQDNQIDGKAAFFVEEAIENIEEKRPETEQRSPLDIVKDLNEKTSEEISGTFLADVFNNLKRLGIRFVDSRVKKEVIENTLSDLKQARTRIQINNKVLKSVLRSVEEDRTGFFADDATTLMPTAESIQTRAVKTKQSSILQTSDYDFEIVDYLGYRRVDPASFNPVTQIVGYVIDKEEIQLNGRSIKKDPIIIENPTTSTTIDLKVKYGCSYAYKIRSIAYMEFQAEDSNSNSIVAISFLVSSRPSPTIIIPCVEEVPPPWPSDFNVEWDYRHKATRIMWSFPVNPQRDIKKFQIFRRKSIYEPFELIKMYDFDDSVVRSPYYEVPERHLIELSNSPKTYFLDKEFTKDSKYIYTICSVDAHGFVSNYSSQYEISFDKFRNKINKKLISTGGAPRAYPNMYIKADTFVDTIKDSGHKRLKIYFNPEFLTVVDSRGNDLKLIKTNRNKGSYKLQLINVDLQSQKSVDINILDKRDTLKKK